MLIFSFLLLPLSILSLFAVNFGLAEQRSRYGALKTVENFKLNGHQIQIVKTSAPTLLSCAQSCLANHRCQSTNFGISEDNAEAVCELNDLGISFLGNEKQTYAKGFIFSLFSRVNNDLSSGRSTKGSCDCNTCVNQGQCLFSQKNEKFQCKCPLPWTGDRCETKIDILFNFTSLGAVGSKGPTTNMKYQGNSLEGTKVVKGLQTWFVPVTGKHKFDLCGASGGDHLRHNTQGGKGARIRGSIHLVKGTQLTVLVGQNRLHTGGGGGGSFVVYASDNTPLAIAGGGGSADAVDGDPGQTGKLGSVNSGSLGKGGKVCTSVSSLLSLGGVGGGGGFTTDGRCFEDSSCNKRCPGGDGGKAFIAGGKGGYNSVALCEGGFGGGGNCGGGGGYTGGGVQVSGGGSHLKLHSGGGGSFVTSASWIVVSGDCPVGNGFVAVEIEDIND